MDGSSGSPLSPGAGATGFSNDPSIHMLQAILMQQQQQIQQQQQQQQQFFEAMMAHQQQQLVAVLQQQPAAQGQPTAAQLLALSSLGQLRAFNGRVDANGLAAREWLTHAEHHFGARELAVGVDAAQGDAYRVHAARNALTDDALRWLSALPQPPTTWAAFRDAFLQRFSSVPAVQVREAQLHRFVDAARRIRDKLTVEGMQRYTTLFLQYAGEIPAERMTEATKRTLYAQGLPSHYAETVLIEDAKAQPPPLHEVAQTVLSKATLKAYAVHGGAAGSTSISSPSPGPTSTSRASDAMDTSLDAISLCAAQFGVSRAEAAVYLEESEGWAPHDTTHGGGSTVSSSPPPSAARASGPASTAGEVQQMERLLAAFEARFANKSGGRPQSQRRNVPPTIRTDIPNALVTARKEAGLCVRCGVAKYEPGAHGHNSRTCKAAVDKTTSAAEGKKQANF
jgi:NACalpha-BTF3-like transcription factor